MARIFKATFTERELQDLLDALPTERPVKDTFGGKTRQWNLRGRLARLQWADDGNENRDEAVTS